MFLGKRKEESLGRNWLKIVLAMNTKAKIMKNRDLMHENPCNLNSPTHSGIRNFNFFCLCEKESFHSQKLTTLVSCRLGQEVLYPKLTEPLLSSSRNMLQVVELRSRFYYHSRQFGLWIVGGGTSNKETSNNIYHKNFKKQMLDFIF